VAKTVLAVGGHIGDMDLTAGPTLAKMVLAGDRAIILACTYGEHGHPTLSPDEYRVQKVREGEEFAAGIGAEFRTLGYSDGFLPDDDDAATKVADIIRSEKPDVIITHWKKSVHRDHMRAAAIAARARFLAALPMAHSLPSHNVRTFLHADNWEDAEGFVPDLYVAIPDDAFSLWRTAIQGQAFARGETYGFRFIDYYTALMSVKGCLVGQSRACGFVTGGGPRYPLADF
jgi:N-acetylglucosamine malate deacetylase 1